MVAAFVYHKYLNETEKYWEGAVSDKEGERFLLIALNISIDALNSVPITFYNLKTGTDETYNQISRTSR